MNRFSGFNFLQGNNGFPPKGPMPDRQIPQPQYPPQPYDSLPPPRYPGMPDRQIPSPMPGQQPYDSLPAPGNQGFGPPQMIGPPQVDPMQAPPYMGLPYFNGQFGNKSPQMPFNPAQPQFPGQQASNPAPVVGLGGRPPIPRPRSPY